MVKGFAPTSTPGKTPISVEKSTEFLKKSFLRHFNTLADPRIDRSKHHLLIDIVAIAILATISGAEGWVGIETYGKAKYYWLKQFMGLPNGLQFHDTFGRVFAKINPIKFS